MNNSKIGVEFKGTYLKQDKVIFAPNIALNVVIDYQLDRWPQNFNTDFTLKNCLFGAVKLTKIADPDKYSYWVYSAEIDSRSRFSFPGFDWGKNVVIFGVDNSSSVHIDNKKKRNR